MALLEYHATETGTGFGYAPDLFRARGETFAILRIDPSLKLPCPYWFTREQLVALRELMNVVLRDWPLSEEKVAEPIGPLQSPIPGVDDAVAR